MACLKIKKQTSRSAVIIYMNIVTSKAKLSKLTIVCKYYSLFIRYKQVVFADEKFISVASSKPKNTHMRKLANKILVCENIRAIKKRADASSSTQYTYLPLKPRYGQIFVALTGLNLY